MSSTPASETVADEEMNEVMHRQTQGAHPVALVQGTQLTAPIEPTQTMQLTAPINPSPTSQS
jgi:hypothetical protein